MNQKYIARTLEFFLEKPTTFGEGTQYTHAINFAAFNMFSFENITIFPFRNQTWIYC